MTDPLLDHWPALRKSAVTTAEAVPDDRPSVVIGLPFLFEKASAPTLEAAIAACVIGIGLSVITYRKTAVVSARSGAPSGAGTADRVQMTTAEGILSSCSQRRQV